MAPTIQQQRDNLNIGLYLANSMFGATLEQTLQVALGFNPNSPYPSNQVEPYERRFRSAQRVGRDAHRKRTPGYFTFNAMSFGNRYIYKATWYVWINPQSGQAQTVPLVAGDLASMRRTRDRDLATRQATTRTIRTAENIEEQRQAVARQDWPALQIVQAKMIGDGSLGEILSGFYGLPYADVEEIIPKLSNSAGMFQFQRDASRIVQTERRLRQQQAALGQQLTSWVMLQTGVPTSAPQLALQQAQTRLAGL